MAHSMILVRVRIAWWLRWYLFGVVLSSHITGMRPDMAKVGWWIQRAVRVEPIGRGRKRALFG